MNNAQFFGNYPAVVPSKCCIYSSPSKLEGVGGSMYCRVNCIDIKNVRNIILLSHFVTAPLS